MHAYLSIRLRARYASSDRRTIGPPRFPVPLLSRYYRGAVTLLSIAAVRTPLLPSFVPYNILVILNSSYVRRNLSTRDQTF